MYEWPFIWLSVSKAFHSLLLLYSSHHCWNSFSPMTPFPLFGIGQCYQCVGWMKKRVYTKSAHTKKKVTFIIRLHRQRPVESILVHAWEMLLFIFCFPFGDFRFGFSCDLVRPLRMVIRFLLLLPHHHHRRRRRCADYLYQIKIAAIFNMRFLFISFGSVVHRTMRIIIGTPFRYGWDEI